VVPKPIEVGSVVSVPHMPHLGCGLVEWCAAGHFLVSFELNGKPYREDFVEGELERGKPRIARTA
jgi:hypothetical protein